MSDDITAQLSQEAYETERKRQVGSYLFDDDISTDETAVYHDPQENKTIIASRGTVVGAKDLLADVGVATGTNIGYGSRFKRTQNTFDAAKSKYKDSQLSATGHSLGGTLSASLAAANDIPATTYNRGAGLPRLSDLKCKLPSRFRPRYCDKITNNRIQGDGVSIAGRLFGSGKWRTTKGRGNIFKRHGIANFN
jgi:hypothetical protein